MALTELELKSIVTSELSDAAGYVGGELSDQRAKAMDYYLGEPFGNEMEGRSQVVSTDVADTIEWILPSLLKTFAASDQAVRFDAEGPEDEQQAEQETDYCNYVFYKENEGFLILYSWFKDALLQKNGIVKIYWDESTKVTREEYENLGDDEFYKLLMDEELEPKEHTERQILEVVETEQGPVQQPVTVHDVVFQRTKKRGKVAIDPLPPEEFKINKDHNSLSLADAHFCAHTVERTISDLIEMGYDRKKVEDLGSDGTSGETEEEIAREHLDDESSGTSRNDKAMKKVKVNECYIRVDYDGDGIAELRKVTLAGNEVLDNEEVDRIPFEAITPIILTHKFFGLSVADIVMDLQLIKSTLWRQMLDNLYLTNNPMREVVEGQVNLDDAMVSRPGGLVRSKQPGMINNLDIPFMAGASFPMLEYVDKIRQQRTGVSDTLQGQNQSLLNDTAHGIERLMSAAESRVELIARIFAETGIKGVFRQMRELLQKHQDKKKVIKLRNKWVDVDPREWRERMNMTAKVGLGTGDRLKLASTMQGVLEIQQNMIAGGMTMLVNPKNIYNAVNDFAKYNGLNDAQAYFTDPDTVKQEPAKEQPNPLAEQENIRGQYKLQETQIKAQADQQSEFLRLQFEQMNREADRRSKEAIEAMKAEIQALIAGQRQDVGQPGIGAGVQSSQPTGA